MLNLTPFGAFSMITTQYFTDLHQQVKARHKLKPGRMFFIISAFGFSKEEYKEITNQSNFNTKKSGARRL